MHGEEGALDVEVDDLVVMLLGDFADGGKLAVTGAGEEDVDMAFLALDGLEKIVEVLEVGGVAGDAGDVSPMALTASSSLSLRRPVMKT